MFMSLHGDLYFLVPPVTGGDVLMDVRGRVFFDQHNNHFKIIMLSSLHVTRLHTSSTLLGRTAGGPRFLGGQLVVRVS